MDGGDCYKNASLQYNSVDGFEPCVLNPCFILKLAVFQQSLPNVVLNKENMSLLENNF